ncbi:MAG TPA: hypothetical protein DHV86_07680 [Methylophilaceae bacterium]|jgi:hypothetical protein|nr:hypothetical protein [Methylophilaceae bacterium]
MKSILLTLMVFVSFGAFADIREERLAAEKKAKLDCKDSLEYNKCIKASYYGVGNVNQDKYEIPKARNIREERLAAEKKAEKKCEPLKNQEDILNQDEYDDCFKNTYYGLNPLSEAEIKWAKKRAKQAFEAKEKIKKKAKKEKALAKYWDGRKEDAKAAREEAELQEKIDRAVANEMARCSPNC